MPLVHLAPGQVGLLRDLIQDELDINGSWREDPDHVLSATQVLLHHSLYESERTLFYATQAVRSYLIDAVSDEDNPRTELPCVDPELADELEHRLRTALTAHT